MLKTTDGMTMCMVMKEIEKHEPFMVNDIQTKYHFCLDGSTSGWKHHDGQIIKVEVDDIWVILSGGGNEIKIPNYNHPTLEFMIINAAELLWFEWDMN